MNPKTLRQKIAVAVASAIVLPLMIVIYLMSRWATHTLDNPDTIVALVVLALCLIAGGLGILWTVEKEINASPAEPDQA